MLVFFRQKIFQTAGVNSTQKILIYKDRVVLHIFLGDPIHQADKIMANEQQKERVIRCIYRIYVLGHRGGSVVHGSALLKKVI